MYLYKKNIVFAGFSTIHGFNHPLGILGTYPLQVRGDNCTLLCNNSETQNHRQLHVTVVSSGDV